MLRNLKASLVFPTDPSKFKLSSGAGATRMPYHLTYNGVAGEERAMGETATSEIRRTKLIPSTMNSNALFVVVIPK